MEQGYRYYIAIKHGNLAQLKSEFLADPRLCDVRPYGQSLVLLAVFEKQLAVLQFLLDQGCDLNDGDDEDGYTPLHAAALYHQVEAARLLLARGAKVDAEDHNGSTPLFRAVNSYRGNPEMVQLLLQHGADPLHRNHSGFSPLAMAVSHQDDDLIRLLSASARRPSD